MQYTIRDIPPAVNRAMRARAKRENKSLNQAVIEALRVAAGVTEKPVKRRDLSEFIGSWVEDPKVDEALRDQDRVDPEMWR